MKQYIKCCFLGLLFCMSQNLYAQVVFRHITSTANITAHITTLDHIELNGKPNAIVFITPNSGTTGMDYGNNVGVWYNGTQWTIFNQTTKLPMPKGVTFNVMVVPAGTPGVFVHTCTPQNTGASGGTFVNGTILNHPSCNGKKDVQLLITQNWLNTYNDNAPQVSNTGGCNLAGEIRWSISNNATQPDGSDFANFPMPVNARFNVMVIENGNVPGFPQASSFVHIAKQENIAPLPGNNTTFLDHFTTNEKPDAMVFATPFWGRGTVCTDGPYNISPISVRYNNAYQVNKWSVCNGISDRPIPSGSKFNVVVVPVSKPPLTTPWYFSPIPAIGVGPSGLPTKKIEVKPYCCPTSAIEVTSTKGVTDNDAQWVNIPLTLPAGTIHAVTVCYAIKGSTSTSFIGQVRLDKMTLPNSALVVHDDPTNLTATTPACYTSKVNEVVVNGTITLSLQVAVATTSAIQIGSVSVDFTPN